MASDQGPTRRVRGPGATSRQRRLARRAWQRWWARYRADGSHAIVVTLTAGAESWTLTSEAAR